MYRDLLRQIAIEIDDSLTWINFSEINRTTHQLCQELLVQLSIPNKTMQCLPCGILHGPFYVHSDELKWTQKGHYRDNQYYEWIETYSGKWYRANYYYHGFVICEYFYNKIFDIWYEYRQQDIVKVDWSLKKILPPNLQPFEDPTYQILPN